MKKIINGKKYHTDTAKMLASNGNGRSDFSRCYEELYQKKTGEFFLYGYGGPMSKYSRLIENNWYGGGEDITPLTEAEAKEWAERHCTVDEYEEIFGEVDE